MELDYNKNIWFEYKIGVRIIYVFCKFTKVGSFKYDY